MRMIGLAHLAMLQIPSDGPQTCNALVMIIRYGKTNKFGKIEYGSGLRNKHVELCPFGALALWFFARFQFSGTGLPDFSDKKNWHFIKVIPGSLNAGRKKRRVADDVITSTNTVDSSNFAQQEEVDEADEPFEEHDNDHFSDPDASFSDEEELPDDVVEEAQNPELDHQSQLNTVSKVLASVGIESSSQTHFFRHASAKTAELEGAPEEEIRRLGRWNNQSLERVYLSPIPLHAAGYPRI